MAIPSSHVLGGALIDAGILPKRTTWFEIRGETGQLLEIRCGFLPENLDCEKVVEIIRSFELRQKEPPQLPPSQ